MASAPNITSAPQQPDLRSFIVYDRLPPGCVVHPITNDDNSPHLRPGDLALIETADREPTQGELFLIEWHSRDPDTPRLAIVETFRRGALEGWMVGGTRARPCVNLLGEEVHRPIRWADGRWTNAALTTMLRGRVVGVLAPRFEEPKRITQELC